MGLELSTFQFALLVLSEVLIAAAGYIINDYFDVQLDIVNRPGKVVIGKEIKAQTAYFVYFALNTIAIIASFYISYKNDFSGLFLIFPVTIGILWFYSTAYKRQFLIGNLLVSLVIAFVPILVVLYEIPPVFKAYRDFLTDNKLSLDIVLIWALMFAAFAFIVNLIRELVKDLQDEEGDSAFGRDTMPIVWGVVTTRFVIAFLAFVVVLGLGWMFYRYLRISCEGTLDLVSLLYFIGLIVAPLIVSVILVFKSDNSKLLRVASLILKLLMVMGVLYLLIVRIRILGCFVNG